MFKAKNTSAAGGIFGLYSLEFIQLFIGNFPR